MTQPVEYSVDAAVATITFNRPESMNSLDDATKQALHAALRAAAADQEVRCVVVTGSGRAFCVGQDLREHADSLSTKSPDAVWSTVGRHFAPIALTLATMDKPVVAAVNGVAAGAGFSIALACDIRLAADTAGFNTAFTGIGLSCDTGISWTLPRVVGSGRALDLLLRPRTVKALGGPRSRAGLAGRPCRGTGSGGGVARSHAGGRTDARVRGGQAVSCLRRHAFARRGA